MKIKSVKKIHDDGNHNAFTDLCWYRDNIYLTFRSNPVGHGTIPGSKIVVMRSSDGSKWDKVFEFDVPERDCRDPHLLVFNNTLFVYSSASCCGDMDQELVFRENTGFAGWTTDARNWEGPQELIGTYGSFIWRAASYQNRAFLAARHLALGEFEGAPPVFESTLMVSEDGLGWKPISKVQKTMGSEIAFLFEENGAILAVARCKSSEAQLCRAQPPYRNWTHTGLGRFIGGPLLKKWGKRYLVGGRKRQGKESRTVVSWLENDRLEDVAELPSGGDTSYPGFVSIDEKHGLLSYYSSHEGSGTKEAPSSIYLAELTI